MVPGDGNIPNHHCGNLKSQRQLTWLTMCLLRFHLVIHDYYLILVVAASAGTLTRITKAYILI
jgi:hypothetical protein